MTIHEFFEKGKEEIAKGWIIAALTDEYMVDAWPVDPTALSDRAEKILEVRIFSAQGELKLSRSDIGRDFFYREIFDNEESKNHRDSYDDLQYLDVDETMGQSADGMVTATGGGMYKLPLHNISNAKIRIRYYFGRYEKTGQARIEDWRVVEFVEGK